jgi:hypothetical protein
MVGVPLDTVGDGIEQILGLRKLHLTKCGHLAELPANISNLIMLDELNLDGCSALTNLPDSIGDLRSLTALLLPHCSRLERLPASVGHLGHLEKLDLSSCVSLRRLPASVGQLVSLQSASIEGDFGLIGAPVELLFPADLATLTEAQRSTLPRSAPWDWCGAKLGRALWSKRKEWTPAEVLRWVVYTGARQVVINKLVREQEAMLTTLERLSWLVLLLATATFMAYIQPPGGVNGETNLVMATEELPCSLQLPGSRGTGNYTQEQMDFRKCAAAVFFIVDGLSFSLRWVHSVQHMLVVYSTAGYGGVAMCSWLPCVCNNEQSVHAITATTEATSLLCISMHSDAHTLNVTCSLFYAHTLEPSLSSYFLLVSCCCLSHPAVVWAASWSLRCCPSHALSMSQTTWRQAASGWYC